MFTPCWASGSWKCLAETCHRKPFYDVLHTSQRWVFYMWTVHSDGLACNHMIQFYNRGDIFDTRHGFYLHNIIFALGTDVRMPSCLLHFWVNRIPRQWNVGFWLTLFCFVLFVFIRATLEEILLYCNCFLSYNKFCNRIHIVTFSTKYYSLWTEHRIWMYFIFILFMFVKLTELISNCKGAVVRVCDW